MGPAKVVQGLSYKPGDEINQTETDAFSNVLLFKFRFYFFTTRIKFQSCCNIDRFAYRAGMSCLLVLEPWKVDVLTTSSLMTTCPEGIYKKWLENMLKIAESSTYFPTTC